MIAEGVIEPSESPWSSPIVIAKNRSPGPEKTAAIAALTVPTNTSES